jgi:hypothetical protein
MAKKKKRRSRVPRKLARLAWERSGAGQHKDKKRIAKESGDWGDKEPQ